MPPKTKTARSAQPLDAAQVPTALLKLATVTAVTGMSGATVYRKVKAGLFPQPVRQGTRCTRWRAAEVAAWAAAQGAAA